MRSAATSIAVALVAAVLSATPSPAADSLKGGRAAVKSSGELAFGQNVNSVTKTATGKYTVRFRRSVAGCYYTVTHAIVGTVGSANLASTLTIYPSPASARELQVFAWHTKNSAYSDEPFMLAVEC